MIGCALIPFPQEGDGFLSGDVQPLWMALGCGFLLLAILAAHGSAALLVYSPTRLRKILGATAAPTLAYLDAANLELRVLARLLTITSIALSLWLVHASVTGSLGTWIFAGVGVLAALFVAVLPAAMAHRGAERVVVLVLPVLRPLRGLLLYPVILPMIAICRPLLRALKFDAPPPTEPDEIADEILAAVSDSATRNTLEDEEREWIGNIVALKQRHVSEVMMPRTDIHALDASLPLTEAIQKAVEFGHSRIPVYQETVDNIVGVFYAKDVLGRLAREEDTVQIRIGEVAREPMFAPESMLVGDLLREFKSSKVQIAIVLDEYGGTAGLITIEDILEEIVGEITDEYDPDEEVPVRVIRGNRILEVSGKARVEEANAGLGDDLVPEGEDYDTVGGFVFSHLGQIPEPGETFQTSGVEYRVLQVAGRRITKMRLTVLEPHPTDG